TGAGDGVDDHRVVDLHPGDQRLRGGGDELVVGLLGPGDEALRRLLLLDLALLLRVVPRTLHGTRVLDDVLGRLHHDIPHGVVARAPRPPGDLVELAGTQDARARAVVLGQPGEEHRADRHVDADAEGVG